MVQDSFFALYRSGIAGWDMFGDAARAFDERQHQALGVFYVIWGTMLGEIAFHDIFLVGLLTKGSTACELFYPLSYANERREEAQEGYSMT